ncbi:glycoside hydrolase family 76 [Purpureocillium lavendulum]|uniref:Glycoside hydrolase family 76 n=1 Tax=Purpureocillium lavendulum TaxID=1247861 RepID=A0AB34FJ83_9HYPO|nr:glycoside hydrolase family 76 [Purpureocillium lavendulum]
MGQDIEGRFYDDLYDWPRPQYPVQDLVSPHIDDLASEYNEWIEVDFHRTELLAVMERISDLLTGKDVTEPEPGFYHQIYTIRQEALACSMPIHLYDQFISSVFDLIAGYGREKSCGMSKTDRLHFIFIARFVGKPREKDYRLLPNEVLFHSTILCMHDLGATIIGYHKDFISLPKELSRSGDVIILVMAVQHEFGLSLKDAYLNALEIHDSDVSEFVRLQHQLIDFGEWQETAQEYVTDLGTMAQGVYAWHVKSTGRYVRGAYAEPEHNNRQIPETVERNLRHMWHGKSSSGHDANWDRDAKSDGDGSSWRDPSSQKFEFTFDLSEVTDAVIEPEKMRTNASGHVGGKDRLGTSSLSESVQNFPEEFGRTYHAYRAGSYAFPNDGLEQERLCLQSECMKILLGGRLYLAPLSLTRPPLRILDVATGVGDWAIEMGDLFPASTVIATDLSPIQPENVPPNVFFYVEDSGQRLTWLTRRDPWEFSHKFDYIHTRYTVGCWDSYETQIAQQAFNAPEYGGWFESQELDSPLCCDDGTLSPDDPVALWFNDLITASDILNRPAVLGATLKDAFERVGFVDVQQRGIKMPIGGWAKDDKLKEVGLMWRANLLEGLAGFSYQLLSRAFNRTADEINDV